MAVQRRADSGRRPSEELKHFTDREDALAVFRRHLHRPPGDGPPVLMFYGVGGRGKSWLLKKLRADLADGNAMPSAFIDFDPAFNGARFHNDFDALIAEVWRQLDVECPRFELAYTMMRFKQGDRDRPLLRHSGKASVAWEFAQQMGQLALNAVPFGLGGFMTWLGSTAGKAIATRLKGTALGEWLLSRAGNDDYLLLSRMTAQDIYPLLAERLGQDLDERLPQRPDRSCGAVVFLDTFEALRGSDFGDLQRQRAEANVRALYRNLTCVFLVLAGRDRLTWDEDDADWADPASLEQHLLGGLSAHDAASFLAKCGIAPGALQEAILRVSEDVESADRDAYHPHSLGLNADTVTTERTRGREPDPATFDMAPGDYDQLAQRFLTSLHDRHTRAWITDLAQTPRFDEAAARDAFSPARDVHQDAAWETLRDYSFVQEAADPGWFRLHSRMSEALRRRLGHDPAALTLSHTRWQGYWQARSRDGTDDFAALAWYHEYAFDPNRARQEWSDKAEAARQSSRMTLHHSLLDWWAQTDVEGRMPDNRVDAAALNGLGVELSQASLGNRDANLRRAMKCFEAALRVRTEGDFPTEWAATQNNLGNAYTNLPTGDRDTNLRRAFECFEAALRVRTEGDFPTEWAATQNNLGGAFRNFTDRDRTGNLDRAVGCFEAALRVYTEAGSPTDWARTQYNLGTTYADITTGDRAANLRRAIECYEAALRVCTEAATPIYWAQTQNNLAIAHASLPTGDRAVNLHRAVECFEAALRVYNENNSPSEWANAQCNLGVTYARLPDGDRDANLRRAIECYEAALRVQTEDGSPTDWATTQNNLGVAYRNLPTGDRAANLRRAVACFEAALRVRTEDGSPAEWAKTENNLGYAYAVLPTGDRDANLRRAIEHYEVALHVRTEADYPADWAKTQNNLGNAYACLPTGDRDANLRRAIEYYEAALRVRTEEAFPADWATTQHNLRLAREALGELDVPDGQP
jgi:tetratricopeptide (TPR) repeat protein